MFRCEICGAEFDTPYIRQGFEHMPDCWAERWKQVLCPVCFEPYFDEIEEGAEEDDLQDEHDGNEP